jgi:hypothetical protein
MVHKRTIDTIMISWRYRYIHECFGIDAKALSYLKTDGSGTIIRISHMTHFVVVYTM